MNSVCVCIEERRKCVIGVCVLLRKGDMCD